MHDRLNWCTGSRTAAPVISGSVSNNVTLPQPHTPRNPLPAPVPSPTHPTHTHTSPCPRAPLQGPKDDKPKAVIRPYTPVTSPPGYMDLVIKAYPTGVMSKHLGDMKVGGTA